MSESRKTQLIAWIEKEADIIKKAQERKESHEMELRFLNRQEGKWKATYNYPSYDRPLLASNTDFNSACNAMIAKLLEQCKPEQIQWVQNTECYEFLIGGSVWGRVELETE